jgi:hypothetical protein
MPIMIQFSSEHFWTPCVTHGEASPAHLAYLEDRVRVHAGQPQLYGTQFTVTGAEFGPCPIEDPKRLDQRRADMGLEPFAVYEARIRNQPYPLSPAARASSFAAHRARLPVGALVPMTACRSSGICR